MFKISNNGSYKSTSEERNASTGCYDADIETKHFQLLATSVLRDLVMLFSFMLHSILKGELKKYFKEQNCGVIFVVIFGLTTPLVLF